MRSKGALHLAEMGLIRGMEYWIGGQVDTLSLLSLTFSILSIHRALRTSTRLQVCRRKEVKKLKKVKLVRRSRIWKAVRKHRCVTIIYK